MDIQFIIGIAAGALVAMVLTYTLDNPAIGLSVGILLGGIYSGVFAAWRRRQRDTNRR